MAVTFKIEHFEGPLDLLLQLIEQEELNISHVSLAKVAEQFVGYVNESKNIPLEEIADFLVVAAKLMYLKSKLLFPMLADTDLDEGSDLEAQLRRYRAFVEASKHIAALWKPRQRSFARAKQTSRVQSQKFLPPVNATIQNLSDLMRRVISRLEPVLSLPQASIERVVTIQERIKHLLTRIREVAKTTFHEFVGRKANKAEMIVSFLALLELVKQRFVKVSQSQIFHDIDIEHHPDASDANPLAESFV